ncbi:hypothetical protein HWV03_11860 [Moritella sp. 36]|uniref:hypothetical protein n=1 Tax=Moritella sp. 36 TaxID=2746233 RepID=UPI001BA8309B|nr:hypothetical protein [Moritella sp. 36]QUM89444.1 hypothetical protein HWV03_11860 [Moritella sp. 36]
MGVFIKDLSKLALPMRHDEILNVECKATNWPPQPVIEIDQRFCFLNNTTGVQRNLFLIPWLCALILLCGIYSYDFVDGWGKSERSAIRYIEAVNENHGIDYFSITTNKVDLYAIKRINEEGVMTINQYINDRYHYYVGGERMLHTDVFILIIAFIAIPGLLYWIITFPRYAPLIFDRQRRLVYSWRKGVITVARYDDLRIYENSTALMFLLRSETKTESAGYFKFSVQPSGNPIINSKKSYKEILVYVAHFMEHGLESVLTEQEFWEGNKGSFLFEDKKPENFDERLAALLVIIDEHGQLIES